MLRFQLSNLEFLARGESEIKEFLSELAVEGTVVASTQYQAFSWPLFLFQKERMGPPLSFMANAALGAKS